MNAQRNIAVLVLSMLWLQSASAADSAKLRGWIAYFKARDPVVEATTNHQKGTIYVMAAMGVGLYYPGIDRELGDQISKAHSVKHLPGMSDAVEGDLHQEYMAIASDYAGKYNQTTMKLLGEIPKT